tara:strand:- start:204 stop:494 length:291 start_codon:yes stop_codon:yes gene_type:complete
MSKNKKLVKIKSLDRNIVGGFCILLFCITFVIIFSTKFIQSESTDSDRRYCADCSLRTGQDVYHDLNDNTATNEIWCENCNKWHAPKNEDSPAIIK